jgi:outer membrane receptor protein involved in Fe transport
MAARPSSGPRLTAAALALAPALAFGGATATPPAPPAPAEVVITAQHAPGEEPVIEIPPPEINAYGVDSLTDLLEALEPQTRSARSDLPPVVLINGRIAGTGELDALPPEAILRVDVLPEKAALRYGLPDTQRVLNFVLRDHYQGLIAEAVDNLATEGGAQAAAADMSWVRVDHSAESALRFDYKDGAHLLESERDVLDTDSDLRTLVPATHEAKLAASFARPFLDLRPTLEASVDTKSSAALQGIAAGDAASGGPLLQQRTDTTTTHVASRVTGLAGSLRWSGAVSYDGTFTRNVGGTGVDAAGALLLEHSDSNLAVESLSGYLGGPVATLPAGRVLMNVNVTAELQGISASGAQSEAPPTASRLARRAETAQLNGNFPLTSREAGILPFLGDIGLRFNARLQEVSNFGLLPAWDLGLSWMPRPTLHLYAGIARTDTAPTLQDLLAPAVATPGVQLFDFATGETVYATEITGGEADLRRTDTRVATFGVYLGPLLGSTAFSAKFEQRRVFDAEGPLPAITPLVESAFPARFLRDASGTLVELDDRPVNLALESQNDLKWGVSVSLPTSRDPSPDATDRWHLWVSAYDTWTLRDTIDLAHAVPELDLLGGAPLSVAGTSVASGQSRHALDLRATLRYARFGTRLRLRWRSATRVDGDSSDPASALYFSDLLTTDLRVYANFATGFSAGLGVTNLFDRRQAVIDATGATPAGFQPGYVDPLGRVLTLSVRKVW